MSWKCWAVFHPLMIILAALNADGGDRQKNNKNSKSVSSFFYQRQDIAETYVHTKWRELQLWKGKWQVKIYYYLLQVFLSSVRYTCLYKASSRTLTSGPGATEQRIADGALTEQRITPKAQRIMPEHHERLRTTAEHHGASQSICLFNDVFFISKWSVSRYIWKQILVGNATEFIEHLDSFTYKLTPLSLIMLFLDLHNQWWLKYLSPVRIRTIISEVAFILKMTICKTIGFLKFANLFWNI